MELYPKFLGMPTIPVRTLGEAKQYDYDNLAN